MQLTLFDINKMDDKNNEKKKTIQNSGDSRRERFHGMEEVVGSRPIRST